MDLTPFAAAYVNVGLEIIALTGKLPNGKLHKHGLHDAISGTVESTGDWEELAGFFQHADTTGIGIVMPPQCAAVDIDGEAGAAAWRELVGDAVYIPSGPVAATGRGLHLWFLSVGQPSRSDRLGPKLDLKGAGGYVAAPPSQHFDAETNEPDFVYTWLRPLVIQNALAEMDELPAPIAERLVVAADIAANIAVSPLAKRGSIAGLVRTVRDAEEGNRNNALAWSAMTARDEGFDLATAVSKLTPAALAAGLTAQETRATIRSAYRGTKRGPR